MKPVKGVTGYAAALDRFVLATERVSFAELHAPYLSLIPRTPSRILDLGAGAGRDAAMMASQGHKVTAVDPVPQFVKLARETYGEANVRWIVDSLPRLEKLHQLDGRVHFVLVSAVWHHLEDDERVSAMSRISELTAQGGIFALSLRNGPAGVGTHVFPTNSAETIELARSCGFEALVTSINQPSLIPGKFGVTWSKLAFRRR